MTRDRWPEWAVAPQWRSRDRGSFHSPLESVRLGRSSPPAPCLRSPLAARAAKAPPHTLQQRPGQLGRSSSASARAASTCNGSGTLTASGSTAQANAISAWAKAYQAACKGAIINYGGGGSGKGVTDFTAGTADFAGSDFPMTATQKSAADKVCTGGEAVDLPMAPGGIAIGYNLPGVTNLNLSAGTIAKIFSGKITKWDDAAIKADNPGVTLPSTAIQTFHRSDGSGTTYNFTNYLTNVAKSDWTYSFGKNWTAPGGQGAKGSAGIAQGVKSTAGGVGYMED